jgi:hypothetical protein
MYRLSSGLQVQLVVEGLCEYIRNALLVADHA